MAEVTDNPRWWSYLNGYHWFVFIMASLAWMFDCLDQQLFILARNDALKYLLPPSMDASDIKEYGGYATSIFMIGWATGGLIFGSIGDRFGRAKTLTLTVLLYSVCTGLSALSRGWIDFAIFRFLTGLGVGGVFGLAVALIADSLPSQARAGALGTLQALSAAGNIAAGLTSMFVARLVSTGTINPENAWKLMFLVGALPAFLCVFLQMKLREPEAWVNARKEGRVKGVKFGSYRSLFEDPRWRKHSLLGMLLCVAGVIGVWGIGFFSPELVGDVIRRNLAEQGLEPSLVQANASWYIGINGIFQNVGAFLGMITFTYLAQALGRRKAFMLGFIAAMMATIGYFQLFNGIGHIWMSSVMGFFQLALFAGFAIYLPELFPLRLRSTGTSFCYNVGRFLAATGPLTLGKLQQTMAANAANADEKLDAFRNAASMMSIVFLVGFVAILFLPETKGEALPE